MLNSILVLQQVNSNSIQHSLTDTITGNSPNSKELLRTHSADLTGIITPNLPTVTNALYAKGLIPFETKNYILTATGISDYEKASRLMCVVQGQLNSSSDPDQCLIDVCHVLRNQQHQRLTDIATSILQQLGECVGNIIP